MVAVSEMKTDQPIFEPTGIHRVSYLEQSCPRIRLRQPRDFGRVETKLLDTFFGLCRGELRWPLFLWGDEGRGKSLAALCMCDLAVSAAWLDVDRICQALVERDNFWWEVVRERHFAVLDEVGGRSKASTVDIDAVKKFADLREQYAGRVAVYISNHPPEVIRKAYGRRIHSRLCCGTIYRVTGPDRRMT